MEGLQQQCRPQLSDWLGWSSRPGDAGEGSGSIVLAQRFRAWVWVGWMVWLADMVGWWDGWMEGWIGF